MEVELALLPLLSRQVEVRRLLLVEPDILLETDAEGRPNWWFGKATPSSAAPPNATRRRIPPAETAQAAGRRLNLSVGRVAIKAGRVTWRDGRTGASRTLGIPGLEVTADGDRGPVRGKRQPDARRRPGRGGGRERPAARSDRSDPRHPLADRAGVAAADATATLEGSIDRPKERRGWKAT